MGTPLLEKKNVKTIVGYLSQALADLYLLYLKTQNFHWNIEDRRFISLHKFLEEQYEALAESVDVVAERIRFFNVPTPATMKQFLELTSLKETSARLTGDQMLRELLSDHEKIANSMRPKIDELVALTDQGSADMFIDFLRFHEKTIWMLRSHLSDKEK